MSKYSVVLRKVAEKELAALPPAVIAKIVPVLKSLEDEPRPHGCKS